MTTVVCREQYSSPVAGSPDSSVAQFVPVLIDSGFVSSASSNSSLFDVLDTFGGLSRNLSREVVSSVSGGFDSSRYTGNVDERHQFSTLAAATNRGRSNSVRLSAAQSVSPAAAVIVCAAVGLLVAIISAAGPSPDASQRTKAIHRVAARDSGGGLESSATAADAFGWLNAQQGVVGASWEAPLHGKGAWEEDVFEWWHGERKLTVYWSEGIAEFVKVWGDDVDHEMSVGVVGDDEAFPELWRWLRTT